MPRNAPLILLAPALGLALGLAACGNDPDKPGTAAEGKMTAKAVADVDAAMAEARRAKAIAPPEESK